MMKHYTLLYIVALLLLALPLRAQEDSLRASRYVVRSTLFGAGFTNVLETYLSIMEYTGPEIRVMRENIRMTNLLDGTVSAQSLLQAHVSLLESKTGNGSEIAALVNWNYALHRQFRINERLKILAGPMLDLNGGVVYNRQNSNNPAQAKAYANLAASAMVIYHFRIGDYPLTARYQANLPLLGILFSPEYGQSYYEMFSLGHGGKNVLFTSLHNQPSLRQLLTLDFPIGNATLRVGYTCDIQQASVNNLKSHQWSHAFLVGFVKNLYQLKGKRRAPIPARLSPY